MLTMFNKLTGKSPLETNDKPIQTFIKVLEKLETQSRQAPEVKSKQTNLTPLNHLTPNPSPKGEGYF